MYVQGQKIRQPVGEAEFMCLQHWGLCVEVVMLACLSSHRPRQSYTSTEVLSGKSREEKEGIAVGLTFYKLSHMVMSDGH